MARTHRHWRILSSEYLQRTLTVWPNFKESKLKVLGPKNSRWHTISNSKWALVLKGRTGKAASSCHNHTSHSLVFQRPIIRRLGEQWSSRAASMRTTRWKFPVSLNAGEFTLGWENNTHCCISSPYLLFSVEITAVCTASEEWRRSGWQNFLVGNNL